MSRVLVVEDSATQALEVRLLLEDAGFDVLSAGDGVEALEILGSAPPDAVLTDLQMPRMDGLELVEEIRERKLGLPVVLMTQHGTEGIAVRALKAGAAGYLAKKDMDRDLVPTIDDVLAVSTARRHQEWLLESLASVESRFVLENNPALIAPLVGYVHQNLARLRFCDEIGQIRIGVALREAVINAIHHGNLEVDPSLRDLDDDSYFAEVNRRMSEPPYRDRRVSVSARESRDQVIYVVEDEGPGFDPTSLPDPTDPANIHRPHGRGLLLIRSFMDEVRHNDRGNQITLIKRRRTA